jgi:hypothetical protein
MEAKETVNDLNNKASIPVFRFTQPSIKSEAGVFFPGGNAAAAASWPLTFV